MQEITGNDTDGLLVYEKTRVAFLSILFILDGFTPSYRLDTIQHKGGIMFLTREDIPSRILNADNPVRGSKELLFERFKNGLFQPAT